MLLGVDGTAPRSTQAGTLFDRNTDVPVMIVAVGSGEHIAEVLPELAGLLHRRLITVERVRVCKRDGRLFERPHAVPGVDEHGLGMWQKVMAYTRPSRHCTNGSRSIAL